MITCSTCIHWKRFHYHPELPDLSKWGDCSLLRENDQEFFIAFVDTNDESFFCTTVETIGTFGCNRGEER